MGFVPNLAVPLAAGATVVTMPRFEPAGYLALAERHRATVLIGAPPLMRALAAGPDLPHVELIVSGGAPLGAELQRAVAQRFPHAAVGQGWGLTETTCGATMPDRERGTVPGLGRARDAEHRAARRRRRAVGPRGQPQVTAGSTPTAGCTPATSAASTPTATSSSSTASRS